MTFSQSLKYLKWKVEDVDTDDKIRMDILEFFINLTSCVYYDIGDINKILDEMKELTKDAR